MVLRQGLMFQHTFWLTEDSTHDEDYVEQLKDWCNENCAGQWMIICNPASKSTYSDDGRRRNVNMRFYSRARNNSPFDNANYPAACIKNDITYIISLEKEEDAIGFKLQWLET